MQEITKKEISGLVDLLLNDYRNEKIIDDVNILNKPDKNEIRKLTIQLCQLVYPGYFREKNYKVYNADAAYAVLIEDVFYHLNKQIYLSLDFCKSQRKMEHEEKTAESYRICKSFFEKIPAIREYVETDVIAAYDGDPAAGSYEEIILAYPGLMAATVSRLAHELYLMNVPVIPRMMTEYAHSETGIDIHPGVKLGKYFFIDHGTGVVIGETSIIGDHVKIYQGVTIGALSTRGGQKLSGKKRHPTIEDNVTIYSNASVLGGDTVIGANAVIGGNAFITSSIPANTVVSIRNQELEYNDGRAAHKTEELRQNDDWFCDL